MSEYFDMGGYAAFIWPAFVLSAIVLITLLATSARTLRESERALDAAGAPEREDSST